MDENEDAARYLLRKVPAAELTPLIVKSPQPVYPAIAKAARIAGSVVVRLIVSEKGVVTLAKPVSGPAMLSGSAIDTAQHWSFRPLQIGTVAVPFTTDVEARFSLAGGGPGMMPQGQTSMKPM